MTSEDVIEFGLFGAGVAMLIGFILFIILLNHSRNKQAKQEQFKLYNGMEYPSSEYMDQIWQSMFERTSMAATPGSSFYDFIMGNHQSRLGQRNQTPDLTPPHKEPEPPKTDRDFIRFGPKL